MLLINKTGSIGRIRLNNPSKRNALSPDMLQALYDAMQELNADNSVHVIIIEAEGKVFCAGADLKYLQQIREKDAVENWDDSRHMMRTFQSIYTSPKIVIAQVQGDAIAGGCGLITICDYVISAKTARFGFTEVAIGFVPALVGIYLLRKIGEAKSRHLLLRANLINAEEAKDLGLVYQSVDAADLETATTSLAEELSKHPTTSIALTKNLLVHVNDVDVFSGLDYAASVNALSRQTPAFRQGIDTILSRISGDK